MVAAPARLVPGDWVLGYNSPNGEAFAQQISCAKSGGFLEFVILDDDGVGRGCVVAGVIGQGLKMQHTGYPE